MHDPDHFQRGVINRSVESITGSERESKWRGWVMATVPYPLRDGIDMRDLRELADSFTSYKLDDIDLEPLREGTEKTTGVRINCSDDVRCHSLQQYVSVRVPKAHPIYLEPVFCDTSLLIGLPTKTYKYVHRTDLDSGKKLLAAYLHRRCDVGSPSWLFPPQQWLSNIRSVLVVRCDGKELAPEHAEALCKICYHNFGDIFSLEAEAQAYRSGSQKERQHKFTQMTSRGNFERFFEGFRSGKAHLFPPWRHVPTPYEM